MPHSVISSIVPVSLFLFSCCHANDYHVAPDGNDSAIGSASDPWKTIQHSMKTVAAGDTVHVHTGIYHEAIDVSVSGSKSNGHIRLRAAEDEVVVIDGKGLPEDATLIHLRNCNEVTIQGFELRNLMSSTKGMTPVAIKVSGTSKEITIADCVIHNIANLAKVDRNKNGRDAHGIIAYGDSHEPISGLKILNNHLHHLTLGSSEALVVNGNIDGFEVKDNVVHDCDNIGIDCIGFENVSPNPSTDQARNGIVSGNHVFNIATKENPAYSNDSSAAGIYVDGGRSIVVACNEVHDCDFGIEVASEHKGKVSEKITVRSNVIHNNLQAGLIMGGYDERKTGSVRECLISNNTFYNNDTQTAKSEWGQICLQYRVSDCVFRNNILVHTPKTKSKYSPMVVHWNKTGGNNSFHHNQYFGTGVPVWVLNDEWIEGWTDYEKHPVSGIEERLADAQMIAPGSNWSLQLGSPCIDSGDSSNIKPTQVDFADNPRIQGSTVDRGAVEFSNRNRK